MFYFYASVRNPAPVFPDRASIFYEWKCQFCSQNRASILTDFRLQF